MDIIIYRSTSQRAMEASHYLRNKFKSSTFGKDVIIINGGLCFSAMDKKLKICIYYGEILKLAGARADYYSSDSYEAELFLSGRCGEKLGGLCGIWYVIEKHMTPKKYYLTTHNPYMSEDWKRKYIDECWKKDVWNMYPSFYIPARANKKPIVSMSHMVEAGMMDEDWIKNYICAQYGVSRTVFDKTEKEFNGALKEKEEKNMNLDFTKDDVIIRYSNGNEYKAKVYAVTRETDTSTRMELYLLDEHPIDKAHNEKAFVTMPRHCGFYEAKRWSQIAKETLFGVDLNHYIPAIKEVKFEEPATIVFWADGTKTVVRAQGEDYDPEKGLAMAISRKALGNRRDYYHVFLRWLKKFRKQKGRTGVITASTVETLYRREWEE